MRPVSKPFLALLVLTIFATSAVGARAECCGNDGSNVRFQQVQLRPGLHGLNDGNTDNSMPDQPPSIGRALDSRVTGNLQTGGVGQMQGNGLGSYGAGSIGEMGPGGLGALHGNGIGGQPPRPR